MSSPRAFYDGPTYQGGNYAPVSEESGALELELIEGELPAGLLGTFARNSSNPRFTPPEPFHWFDGDGMVHTVAFQDGKATYRNRFVRTAGLAEDEAAQAATWTGLLAKPDLTRKGGPYKNTANTDLTYFGGKLLATWWQGGGHAYAMSLPDLATEGPFLDAGTMTAHAKVDPKTGNLVFIDYDMRPPFLTYGELTPAGELTRTPIELSGPRPQHDVAVTDRFAILLDVSMFADPEQLAKGRVHIRFFPDTPTRIGLFDRKTRSVTRWFEVEPCYIYHLVNAWEEGDDVVITSCRVTDPLMYDPQPGRSDRRVPHLAHLRLEPEVVRWRLNTATGDVTQDRLDDTLAEFPRIDDRLLGRPCDQTWLAKIAEDEAFRFDGVRRSSLADGTGVTRTYPQGWYGGEVSFVPLSETPEEGCVATFVAEEATGTSELWLMDAGDLSTVARLAVPKRVPTGFHSKWIGGVA